MSERFNSSTGDGYVLQQCNNENTIFFSFIKLTVFSISSISDIPVETITGLLSLEIWAINGKFVKSAEAILYAGTPNFSRKSTLDISQGVQRKVIFFPLE